MCRVIVTVLISSGGCLGGRLDGGRGVVWCGVEERRWGWWGGFGCCGIGSMDIRGLDVRSGRVGLVQQGSPSNGLL